ncbi:MAG TPA: DMT family transporter [Opitutaceae bacterium]|nr:DMT family transporter [Opitutaceae bacterium]
MLGAFLTTIFFSLSVIFANRSIAAVGITRANLGRLLVALFCLGVYAHTFGRGFGGAGRDWFLLSGLIGMGLGDLASFSALPLLGSRLSILMSQCLAVPIAIVAERAWLGTRLTASQFVWGAVILGGVALALMPTPRAPPRVRVRPIGFVWGFLSAAGQGVGAVVSRRAAEAATGAGETVDGITAAYQRIIGGLVITAAFFILRALLRRERRPETAAAPSAHPCLWIVANALCGAVIGVSCYQWALATTPSGLVLPIVATTPLVIIPFSYLLEGERPSRRSLAGGAIAVAGAVALTLAR